ncbi:unnamed protein product, partial [Discosporangium mesarthrocarpum]
LGHGHLGGSPAKVSSGGKGEETEGGRSERWHLEVRSGARPEAGFGSGVGTGAGARARAGSGIKGEGPSSYGARATTFSDSSVARQEAEALAEALALRADTLGGDGGSSSKGVGWAGEGRGGRGAGAAGGVVHPAKKEASLTTHPLPPPFATAAAGRNPGARLPLLPSSPLGRHYGSSYSSSSPGHFSEPTAARPAAAEVLSYP